MTTKDYIISAGLIGGGIALKLAMYKAQNKAKAKASAAFKAAVDNAARGELSERSLNKIRAVSENSVNIGRMNGNLQGLGSKDNAFWISDKHYKNYARALMAKEVLGDHGTIAIGDDARALPVVAHELGHAENYRKGRALKRALLSAAGTIGGMGVGTLIGMAIDRDRHPLAMAAGGAIGGSIGSLIGANAVYDEEKKASENAIKYLKAVNRPAKYLDQDKKTLEAALDTYDRSRFTSPIHAIGNSAIVGGSFYALSKLLK